MEAVVRPPAVRDGGPIVLLDSSLDARRGAPWAVSVLVHAAGIAAVLLIPWGAAERPRLEPPLRSATPLIAPPRELTQREPNRGKVAREFTLEGLLPRPAVRVPTAVPPVSRAAKPPVPAPRQVPEAPALESSGPVFGEAPPVGSPLASIQAPPQIQAEEKPKIAFEPVGGPPSAPRPGGVALGRIPVPGGSVSEATRAAARRGAGGMVLDDIDLSPSPGISGGLNLPGSPAAQNRSSLELLSDPQGVDFKPYLIQVLAAVKRRWLAVIPESARLGRRGRTQVQFAIARDGSVPKLVVALPSGTDAFDRAAVAGVSASVPFPPLPATFRGEQIRLQLTFLYNLK